MTSSWDLVLLIISSISIYLLIMWIYSQLRREYLPAQNKAVLITGCDSGFGYMLSQRMAQLGYKVLAGCLLVENQGAQELKSFSSNIKIFPLDVTDDQSVKNAAKFVSEELAEKELWAVVNNAGIAHSSEMEWTPLQTILDVFNVNTFGMVRVTQRLLPFLKKSKGRLINVTSASAEIRMPGFVGYTMSKAAAKNFNDVIRLELRRWGIKVINIAPYFYGTNITDVDKLVSLSRDAWKKSEQDSITGLRDEYLEDYIRNISEFLKKIMNLHVSEVIDCLEDAITSSSPKLCYHPGNILNKLVLGVVHYFPTSIQDYIQSLILPSIKKN